MRKESFALLMLYPEQSKRMSAKLLVKVSNQLQD